ncbi:50S ribosomal protein L29 [candidate division CPR3 bacterium 4484_211]|uniref:Large ribosomal subunit protein uL29 n=1 Tax=candidate division CPR3 bacterium 4484_211 TaxID=1968527 RepID=A0A1W9P135_UNCC3|nr:MAG: 50S ribosomal protein L29 [candidate division CPR3 bacterium 4484_211]
MKKTSQWLKEIRSKDINSLNQQLQELRLNLAKLNLDHSLNKLKDYSQIKKLKKKIARLLTVLNTKRKEEKYAG